VNKYFGGGDFQIRLW